MRAVNRFESNLLKIVYCVFGNISLQKTLPVLAKSSKRPKCLSRDTVELVKQALTKGITKKLASDSGWKIESFLRAGKSKTGRLWDRSDPESLGLEFSKHSLDFLIWMTCTDLTRKTFWKMASPDELTLGDKYLMGAVWEVIGPTDIAVNWSGRELMYQNGLAVLLQPKAFAKNIQEADFQPWVTGQGAAIMEAMQGNLAAQWVKMEESKFYISGIEAMLRLGQAQGQTLTRFMDAADAAGRRDLCRFVLVALSTILKNRSELKPWICSLDVSGLRVADRTGVYESAAALLLQAPRLQKWHQESLTSGYLDENYAIMQLWKSEWERMEIQPSIDKAIQISRAVSF